VICKRLPPVSEMAAAEWGSEQQRLLQAMGYQLLRPVRAAAGPAKMTQASVLPTQLSAANTHSTRPRFSLPSFPRSAESTAQQMLVAVLRAAGLSLDAVELVPATVTDEVFDLPPLDLLLSSALTRRALWPQLRQLRRRLAKTARR